VERRSLLRDAPGTFDYLATHFVVGRARPEEGRVPEFVALAGFALPVELERRLRHADADLADGVARDRVKIAVHRVAVPRAKRQRSAFHQHGAVCAAGFLNTLIRTADFVPISDMTGLVEFGGFGRRSDASTEFRPTGRSGCTSTRRCDAGGDADHSPRYDVKEGIAGCPTSATYRTEWRRSTKRGAS
jgi:hypothetical protein